MPGALCRVADYAESPHIVNTISLPFLSFHALCLSKISKCLSAWELVFLHNSRRCSFFSRHSSHLWPRSSGRCFPRAREPGFTPSNRRAPQVCRKAPKIDRGRPPAVDLSVAPLARLALAVGHRQARNGRRLASCRLSLVLDLEGALPKTRTTRHFKRSPRSDSQDVPGESRLGCTTDPRRTSQTRHRHRREQCQQIYGALPQTAVSDLAHLPGEPCPAAGLDRLLHRAHHPVPGPLRISGFGP